MQDFRKLQVWHDALSLAADVYRHTKLLPREERFGLQAQMRSAAVSIVSNIAEGCGRPTSRDMARFLGISIGSASELESQIHILVRLELLPPGPVEDLMTTLDLVKRRLIRLYRRVYAVGRADRDDYM